MTSEERIAHLEALVAEKDRMLAIQAQALADAMAAVRAAADDRKALEARRAGDRERKNASRIRRLEASSRDRCDATSRDSHVTTPPSSPPFPSPFPPSPEPSSPYPLSFPPSSPSPSASQEPAVAAPASDFELTSPSASKPQRKQRAPTPAEALFRKIQETREARCVEVGEAVVPERWDVARQNKVIGDLLKEPEEARQRFEAAWGLYLADDGERVREPAWSLSWFMTSGVRARYETRAAREGL